MPYEVVKIGSKWQVRNKKTKRVLGTHPSRVHALKQLAAVEIHTHEGSAQVPGAAPNVAVRGDQGELIFMAPHQAKRLFFSNVPLEGVRRERRPHERREHLS